MRHLPRSGHAFLTQQLQVIRSGEVLFDFKIRRLCLISKYERYIDICIHIITVAGKGHLYCMEHGCAAMKHDCAAK